MDEMILKAYDHLVCGYHVSKLYGYPTLKDFLETASSDDISRTAYWWRRYIGHREIMIDYVIAPYWAYVWAHELGDREIMIERITDCEAAFYWAKTLGDVEVMKLWITDPIWIDKWNKHFHKHRIN